MPSESAKKRQAQKKERERQRQQASARKKQQQKTEQVNGDVGVNGESEKSEGACAAAVGTNSSVEEVKSKLVDLKMASRSCTGDPYSRQLVLTKVQVHVHVPTCSNYVIESF